MQVASLFSVVLLASVAHLLRGSGDAAAAAAVTSPLLRRSLTAAEDDGGQKKHAPTIPHTFWFNHNFTNILGTQDPARVFDNVAKTMETYGELWGDHGWQFVDEEFCRETLSTVAPRLVPHFNSEPRYDHKGDVCVTAALYLYGGYFFDTNVQVLRRFHPPPDVRFVAVLDCGGGCFSPTFMASTQWHPVLRDALEIILRVYETDGDRTMLGPVGLANAYHGLSEAERADVRLLEMIRLEPDANYDVRRYRNIEPTRGGDGECNDIVHDPTANVAYFYKRFRGEGGGCVREHLRLDWSDLQPISPLARRIDYVQSRCPEGEEELPDRPTKFKLRERVGASGLGADLMRWSASLCDATERDMVLLNRNEWVWMDSEKCPINTMQASPLRCYFGRHESASHCTNLVTRGGDIAVTAVDDSEEMHPSCVGHDTEESTNEQFRAASFEWLFQSVNPIVLEQARLQVSEAFEPDGLPDPDDLVTVHIRWGDKWKEMNLRPIEEYIDAVMEVDRRRKEVAAAEGRPAKPLHVYIASEDFVAFMTFWVAAPEEWRLHKSGPFNDEEESDVVKNASGRAGLESLAALLVSMEANHYVLTTASHWSHLMEYLRRRVLDPRCGNCTHMVDLYPPRGIPLDTTK